MLSNRALWPAMIGIALAVGIGVQMGESAIGSIDPIHFQGAAPPVQGIDPNAPPPPQSSYAQAYGWEQGSAARLADGGATGTSGAHEDFDYVPQVTVHRAAAPAWQVEGPPVPLVNLAPWPPGQVTPHPEVERYTDYPVEQKPAAQPEPQAPAPQPDASSLSPTAASSPSPTGK